MTCHFTLWTAYIVECVMKECTCAAAATHTDRCTLFPAQTAGATSTVAASMQKASQAMAAMGQAVDPRAMQQSMAAFARENQRMNMASGACAGQASGPSVPMICGCSRQASRNAVGNAPSACTLLQLAQYCETTP